MVGFLIKLVLFIGVIAVVIFFAGPRVKNVRLSDVSVSSISSGLKNIDVANLGKKLSQSLDNLVTRPGESPVVLGVQITNTSLDTIINLVRKLPPDQMRQIRNIVCQPSSPGASLVK